MSCVSYASVVSNLMYAMVCIRSNLAQAVNVVSRYMGNPGKKHWQDVKHIFRYLKGTTNIGLVYHGDISCALTCCLYSTNVIDLDAIRGVHIFLWMSSNNNSTLSKCIPSNIEITSSGLDPS